MIFDTIQKLLGKTDTEEELKQTSVDDLVTISLKYHEEKELYLIVYRTATNNQIYGSGSSISLAFSDLDVKQSYLTERERTLLKEAQTLEVNTTLTQPSVDGKYVLTITDGSNKISASGRNMSDVFSNMAAEISQK